MTVGPALVIATDGVYFDGALVAAIEGGAIVERALDGYRIPALVDPLRRAIAAATATDRARDAEPSGVVTLFADQRVTFAALLPILYTSGQAGGRGYDFAVQPTGEVPGGASDVLRIYPPKFLAEGEVPTETKVELMMMVSQTDVRIGRHDPQAPQRSAWIERIPVGADRRPAMDRITELARGLAAEEVWDADVPTLRVGSERDVPLDLLVAAITAAAGPECVFAEVLSQSRRCYFYAPVIYGGSPVPPDLVDP